MAARRKTKPQGPRTKLMLPGVHKGLVDRTKAGVPVGVAATSVGIAERTFLDWMQRGAEEEERIAQLRATGEEDPKPDPYARIYLDLYREVMQARADAAVRAVANVQKAAAGGFVTEETTKRYTDKEGNEVEEYTIKRAAPDWRAASWYLERQHRRDFGRDAVQVEVTGQLTESAAMPVVDSDDLAKRIAVHAAAIGGPLPQITAGPDDEVVDAEIIQDAT